MFSKLTHVVASELAQVALPLHSFWIRSMALLHVVLQSLWSEKVHGTEWTLINMCLGMPPKFCDSLEFLITNPYTLLPCPCVPLNAANTLNTD